MRRQPRLRAALLALLLVIASAPLAPRARAASADYIANCDVNLRAGATVTATVVDVIASGTIVTASGTVTGDAWSTACPSTVSGNTWYAITAVGGASTSSLYGVATVYAAAGLFSASPLTGDLEGVDVSQWQGTIDFGKVRASGRSFVIAKATEGIGYADPAWATNKANARAAGLALGAYHFARPDLNATNPAGEADWFVDTMDIQAGMLQPALDLEVPGTLSVDGLTTWVKTFLQRVYDRTGARAMIYTSPSFWKKYLGDTRWFADNGYQVLWVAHWTSGAAPTVPASNWGGRSWTFWQYTNNGSVPGISARVDLDRFNGTDLTAVTYNPDFSLATGPAAVTMKQGASSAVAVSVVRDWFNLPVTLAVGGLPPGATASLAANPVSGSGTTLSVSTSASGTITPPGTYPITVSGTAAGVTRQASVTVTVTDGIPPAVSAPDSALFSLAKLGSTVPVRVSWAASDPSGIASMSLLRRVNTGSWAAVSLPSAATRSVVSWLTPGATYRFAARAVDGAGNASGWRYGPSFRSLLTQQYTSVAYSSRWYTSYTSAASGGSLRYTTTRGAWASFRFTGRSIAWVAYRGPNRGAAAVYIDGSYRGTVSLYSRYYYPRQIMFATSWAANGTHTIKIVCLGTSGRPRIDLDAFVRLVNS